MSKALRITVHVLLVVCAAVCLGTGRSYAKDLKTDEVAARQTAARILDALKPIESWLDSVPAEPPPTQDVRRLVEVTGNRVNLRTGPSLDAPVLMVADQGEVFEYIDGDGDWYRVRTGDDRRAYISRQFAKIVVTASQPPPQRAMTLTFKPGYEPQARTILGQQLSDVDVLDRLAERAEAAYENRYGDARPDGSDAAQGDMYKSLTRIRKYQRVVKRKFERYSHLTGALQPAPRASQRARAPIPIRGSVRAGLGANTATVEVVDASKTDTDVTRSEIAADVTADVTPNDRLNLSAIRKEEIRFAPATQTRGAVDYARKLGSQASVGARIGLDQYKNDANDLANVDRTELGMRGTIAPSKSFQANADVAMTSASYPNNDPLDYKDTRLALGASGTASPKVSWGAGFAHTTHDLDDNTVVDDNTRSDLNGNLTFRTGQRSSVAIVGQSEGVAFDDDNNPGNYRRTGLGLQGRSRGRGGRSSSWLLGFESKGYDVVEDRNYIEFRGEVQSRRALGTNEEQSSKMFVNYRNFDGENNAAYLDYIEGRWDHTNARKAILWESNTYAQYFLKNGDAERNARVDQFAWLGFILGAAQAVVIGPHIATTTEIVTVDGTGLGAFESPNNTVRYGVKGKVRINALPIRIDGEGRFEKTEFYNIDNASSPIRVELQANGTYKITRSIDATGRVSYYTVGADDPGSIKTSEIDLLFGVIYHIGRRP